MISVLSFGFLHFISKSKYSEKYITAMCYRIHHWCKSTKEQICIFGSELFIMILRQVSGPTLASVRLVCLRAPWRWQWAPPGTSLTTSGRRGRGRGGRRRGSAARDHCHLMIIVRCFIMWTTKTNVIIFSCDHHHHKPHNHDDHSHLREGRLCQGRVSERGERREHTDRLQCHHYI